VPFTQADKERLIRIEVTLEQFMKATDKRFEMLETTLQTHIQTTNARFERVENAIQTLLTLLMTLVGIFLTTLVGLIGYVVWDRRAYVRPVQARVEGQEVRMGQLLAALRELAQSDERIAQLLKKHHLL
jgi:nitrate reductase NapE component